MEYFLVAARNKESIYFYGFGKVNELEATITHLARKEYTVETINMLLGKEELLEACKILKEFPNFDYDNFVLDVMFERNSILPN